MTETLIDLEVCDVRNARGRLIHTEYTIGLPALGKNYALRWYLFFNDARHQPWGVSVSEAILDGLNRFTTKTDALNHIAHCTLQLLHQQNPMLALLADFSELLSEADRS